MIINCSQRLLDELKIKPTETENSSAMFSWHANLIRINHRKTLIITNDSSRFSFILYGLRGKDFKHLWEYISQGIQKAILDEGIKAELLDHFMAFSPTITFRKAENKSLVLRLNSICVETEFFAHYFKEYSVFQPYLNKIINSRTVRIGENKYECPYALLYKDFETLFETPIFGSTAVQIKIKIQLEKFDIWRTLLVPLYYSFESLHQIIQLIFDWSDDHLHDFIVLEGANPIANLVSNEEAFQSEEEIPLLIESDVRLRDYLPKYKKVNYIYDFGDCWEHSIEVETIIFGYDKPYPTCIDGKGNRPPEDVGGEEGYEEYLRIVSDPKNEVYEEVKIWAKEQSPTEFNLDRINKQFENRKF